MGEWFDDLPAPMSVDRAMRTDTPGIGRANTGGKAPPRPERGKVYSSDSGSYWSDAGKVAKGYFWEGPKALVTGLYHVATTDPRVTAQNLADGAGTLAGNLVYNTSDTLSSIGNAFVDPNTAGQAWFNAALVGVPVARAAHARFGASAGTAVVAENAMFSSSKLMGVERASTSLLEVVGSRRAVTWATEGSDALRFLNYKGAEAAAFGVDDIILRLNPSKAAVLEEFLHGTQARLGIIDRLGRAGAEAHVKSFMIRYQRTLGLSPEDVAILKRLRDAGL